MRTPRSHATKHQSELGYLDDHRAAFGAIGGNSSDPTPTNAPSLRALAGGPEREAGADQSGTRSWKETLMGREFHGIVGVGPAYRRFDPCTPSGGLGRRPEDWVGVPRTARTRGQAPVERRWRRSPPDLWHRSRESGPLCACERGRSASTWPGFQLLTRRSSGSAHRPADTRTCLRYKLLK